MSGLSDRSRPAGTANSWTPARIIVWVVGGVLTLITGTIIVGLVVGLLFGDEGSLLSSYAVGFAVSAIYLGWRVTRAIRRTE
ncbi:hypothetical protein [Nocardia sp. NPDC052112]|uniref:hypothetical protein n=1 Tax=Nocardia sp. NPDC052112 TaxID=3155646 RepID=UPI0034298A58